MESIKKYADDIALTCMDKNMTFKELDALSSAFGGYLRYIGCEPGDRIALMMPNLL